MSSPWLKFYPSDWRADPALRMCSLAARGLWIEMLCIMHEATPRGELRINGSGITSKQLGGLAGYPRVDALLDEMETAGVFSRTSDGVIYSRRMIRDDEKAMTDKANGRRGGNPSLKGGVNPEDKAQKPEARVQSKKEEPVGSSKKRASRLPDDFLPSRSDALDAGLDVDGANREWAKFRDYWRGVPGQRGVKLDWAATWRNWCRKAAETHQARAGPARPRNAGEAARDELKRRGMWFDATDETAGRVGQGDGNGHVAGPGEPGDFALTPG